MTVWLPWRGNMIRAPFRKQMAGCCTLVYYLTSRYATWQMAMLRPVSKFMAALITCRARVCDRGRRVVFNNASYQPRTKDG